MRLSFKFYLFMIICILYGCTGNQKEIASDEDAMDFNFTLEGNTLKSSGQEYIGVPLLYQKDKVLDWNKDSILIKVICEKFQLGKYSLKVNNQQPNLLIRKEYLVGLSGLTGLTKIELCKENNCLSKYINIDRDSEFFNVSDSDGDGVADNLDNCISVRNSDQLDSDDDGKGDVCDNDDDNDGVRDKIDRCPKSGVRGKVDSEGCPVSIINKPVVVAEKDTDGDGFVDSKDRCPNDFSRTNSGCPDIEKDSDGDGILDKYDSCPQTGSRGDVDTKGCPKIKDTDKDGFSDALDKCPNEFSRTNNGCPEEMEEVLLFRGNLLSGNLASCNTSEEIEGPFAFSLTPNTDISLQNIRVLSAEKWQARVQLFDYNNQLLKTLRNIKINPTRNGSEIDLSRFERLKKGKKYNIIISGSGNYKLVNIKNCISNEFTDANMTITIENYLSNLNYLF